MSSIDERIVKMQFENNQFESNAKTSLNTLDRLKKALNFDESTKSFNELEKTSKSFSMSGVSSALQTVSSRFTNLGIIGVTALQRITNEAITAGTQLVKSLSLDPILTGFTEYETKINAITTILTNTASKGTTLDDVNEALAELNTYADQTIYNFAEMTRNIGTFTAAGVDLDTAVNSIKGIANLAAGSGSSAQQAATAMYQLSQAIAAGRVSLMDWNSVVNAGMGGEMFQNALKETAKQMGIIVDEGKPFRETLQDGWLTAEVLTETLSKFAEDESLVKAATQVKTFTQLINTMQESVQSGWATSWEYIIGTRDEAAETLTTISDAFNNLIGPVTDARNEMLKFWHDNGGRDALIEGLSNAFNGLLSILRPIQEAFRNIFPAMTGERLVELSEGFRDLTENFKIGEDSARKIQNVFEAVFSVFRVGVTIVTSLVKTFFNLISALSPVFDGILSISSALGSFISKGTEAVTTSGAINAVFESIGSAFDFLGDKLRTGSDSLGNILSGLGESIVEVFKNIPEVINSVFSSGAIKSSFDVINSVLLSNVLVSFKKFADNLTGVAKESQGILEGFTSILDGVRGVLEAWQANLRANVLLKLAGAIGILAVSLVVLSAIKPERLTSSLMALTVMFIELFTAMAIFEKLSGERQFLGMLKLSSGLIGVSTAILILSAAMTKLAEIKTIDIIKGLLAIFAMIKMLTSSAKKLSKVSGPILRTSVGLIAFSAAINVLSEAVKSLSGLNVKELATGLGGVGVLCAEISLFLKTANLDNLSIGNGVGLITLAAGLRILADAVSAIGSLSVGGVAKGLAGITVLFTELAVFTKVTANAKNVLFTAAGLTVLSTALLIFSKTMQSLGSMSWGELGRSFTALAGGLTVLTVALKAMSGTASGLTSLILASSAIAIFAPSIALLSGLSWTGIAKGLITLAGAFAIMGAAGVILTPLAPTIVALAGALALFGVGVTAIGAGLFMAGAGLTSLATGFASLAVLGATGAVAVVDSLSIIFQNVLSFIPQVIGAIGEGVVEFAEAITAGAPAILTAITTIFSSTLSALLETLPQFVSFVGELVASILQEIATRMPDIIQAGADILIGLLEGVANNIQKIVETAADVVVNFINGIASKLPDIIQAGFDLILSFIRGLTDAIKNNGSEIIEAVFELFLAVVQACFEALMSGLNLLYEAGVNLVTMLIDGIVSLAKTVWNAAKDLIGNIIDGIKSRIKDIWNVGKDIITGLINGIKSGISSLFNAAKNLATGFIDTVKGIFDSHSPSKVMEDIGGDVIQGFENGITENSADLKDTTESVFEENVVDPIEEAVEKVASSMKYGAEAFKVYVSSYKGMMEVIDDETDIVDHASKVIEDYGKQLYEESAQYEQDTETIKEHKEELEDLQKTRDKIQKELEAVNKKNSAESKERVNELKADLKEVNTAIEEANDQIIQDQNEVALHTKETFNELRESLIDTVEGSLDPLKTSLDTQIDLFEEFGSDTEVIVSEILYNMESQVKGVEQWNKDLDALAEKGFAKGLIDQLREMGPSGVNYVNAFMTMTASEMERANEAFQKSSEITAQTLIDNFEDSLNAAKEWANGIQMLASTGLDQGIIEALGNMGTSSADYVNAFLNMTAEQIAAFNQQYQEYLSLPVNIADQLIASYAHAGDSAASSLVGEILNNTSSESQYNEQLETNGLNMGATLAQKFSEGLDSKKKEVTSSAIDIGKTTYNGLNTYVSAARGRALGQEICNGLIYGLKNNENAVKAAAVAVARAAYAAAMAALGISSPSKKFAEIGKFADEGLAYGLTKNVTMVTTASKNLGENAISSLKNAIGKISEVIDGDLDTSPMITPVLDMNQVNEGVKEINDIFNKSKFSSLGRANSTASAFSRNISAMNTANNPQARTADNVVFSFEQNNYSPKALSRIDIYRQTKNQFSAMKGALDNL